MHQLQTLVALVALIAPCADAGSPPVVTFQNAPFPHLTFYAAYGIHLSTQVSDPDGDLVSVTGKVIDETDVYAEAPLTSGWQSYQLHAPGVVLDEKLHAFVVTATDAEGSVTVGVVGVWPIHPPAILSAGLTPETPTASEPVLLSVEIDEENPTGGTAYIEVHGSPHNSYLEVELDWNPGAARLEGWLDGLPFGGVLFADVVAKDPWSTSAPFSFTAQVTHAAPSLDAVTPDAGALQAATPVTIHGDGFFYGVDGGSLVVRFGEQEVVAPYWPTDETLVVVPPAASTPGTVDVTVSMSKGGQPMTATLADAFTYLPGPAVESFDPRGASAALGFEMRIVGSGFLDESSGGDTTVHLGEHEAAEVEVLGDEELRAVFEPIGVAPKLAVDLTVAHGGGTAIMPDAFRFHDVRLLSVGALPLPATTPARAATFVGWLDGEALPGSLAVGLPDAPPGEKILVHRPGADDAPSFLDGSIPAPAGFVLGDLVGFESKDYENIHPGEWAPELLVGSLEEPGWGSFEAGALHALGSQSGGSIFGLAPHDELGCALTPVLDEDEDGVAEVVLAGAPGSGRVYLLGAHYGDLWWMPVFASAEPGDRHGASLAACVVGDETYFATGAPAADPAGVEDAGSVHLHQDSWYGPIYLGRVDGDEPAQNSGPFGEAMPLALLTPITAGHRPILVKGHPGASDRRGRVDAIDTQTGDLLWSRSGVDPDDGFGSALVAIPDLDGDAVEELVIGAPGEDGFDAAGADAGAVHLLSGATGDELLRVDGEVAGERFGSAVFESSDIDHNLLPEVLVATDATVSANALRRFSTDPRRDTFETSIGNSLKGTLFGPRDVDGLTIALAPGEKLECRVYGDHSANDPLVLALVDDEGATIVSTSQVDPDTNEGPSGVKRMKDHWRLRYLATESESVHVLTRAPRTEAVRSYVLETDRVAGGELEVTAKAKIPAGDDAPVELVFDGVAEFMPYGKVEVKGAQIVDLDLLDAHGDEVIGGDFWHLKKDDHVAVLGDDCVPILSDQVYTLVVDTTPPAKKAKVKATLLLVKPLSHSQYLEWQWSGGD